jgi:sugar lactone lactonase YvrE
MLLAGCTGLPEATAIDASSQSIRTVIATNTDVYWTDRGFDPAHARIMHASLGGGTAIIADHQFCESSLVMDEANLMWGVCDGTIVSAPRAGGATVALGDANGSADNLLGNVVATTDTIYASVDGPAGQIVAMSKQPGVPPTTVVSNLTSPRALATDDANLYWIDEADAALYQRAHDADAATPPTKLATVAIDFTTRVIPSVATDGVHVYWSDANATAVHAMRIADGMQFELATHGYADAFALDASHVYWISGTTREIQRAPLAGGDTEQVAAIHNPTQYPAATIAVNDDAVFWGDNPADCDETIMDCFATTIESVPK